MFVTTEGRQRTVSWADPTTSAVAAKNLGGLQYLQAAAAGTLPLAPIAELFGMEITSVEHGRVSFTLDLGEHLYNPLGSVHGGVFCTLLDSAMGCAVHSTLAQGQTYATLQLNVQLIKGLTIDTRQVIAEGEVISAGRRVATASGRLVDRHGTLYAHATTTCLITSPRPPLDRVALQGRCR